MHPYKQSARWQDVLDQVFCWFLLHRFLEHLLPPSSGQKKEASQERDTSVRVIRDQGVKKKWSSCFGEVTADWRRFERHIEKLRDLCSSPDGIVSVMAPRRRRWLWPLAPKGRRKTSTKLQSETPKEEVICRYRLMRRNNSVKIVCVCVYWTNLAQDQVQQRAVLTGPIYDADRFISVTVWGPYQLEWLSVNRLG